MTEGTAERLRSLRAIRGLSQRELAARSGVAYSKIVQLEMAKFGPDAVPFIERLARFYQTTAPYILDDAGPDASDLRYLFTAYWSQLAESERERLSLAPIQARLELVLGFLEQTAPTRFSRASAAAMIGYTEQSVSEVLADRAPVSSLLLKGLAALCGIDQSFLVRGNLAEAVPPEADSAGLEEYYAIAREAREAGISPLALRAAVRSLAETGAPEQETTSKLP